MRPKISSLPSFSSSQVNKPEDARKELSSVQNVFSSHNIEQRQQPPVPLPEAILTVNPVGKQETASVCIGVKEGKNEPNVDLQSVLEQQISGVLQEASIKGFEVHLDRISFSKLGENPANIEAHISCSTSYDNRENVEKALERIHAIVLPVLQKFASGYHEGYKSSGSLSREDKEIFLRQVQEIVAKYMPKEAPSIESLVHFVEEKPIFSLSPQYVHKEGARDVLQSIQKLMKRSSIGGLAVFMETEVIIDDSVGKETSQRDTKHKQQAYNRLIRGKKI